MGGRDDAGARPERTHQHARRIIYPIGKYRRGMHEPCARTRARSSLLAARSASGAEARRGAGAEPTALRGATAAGAAAPMVRLAMGTASLALRRAGTHARPRC